SLPLINSGLPLIPAAVPPERSVTGPDARNRIRWRTGITSPPPCRMPMISISNSSIFWPWMTVRPMPRMPGLMSRSGMIGGSTALDCAPFDPMARPHHDLPDHAVAAGARRDPDRAGQRRADVHQRLSVVYLIAGFHQTVLQHHARQGALHLEQIRGRGEPRPNSTRRKCLTVPRQPVELERGEDGRCSSGEHDEQDRQRAHQPPYPANSSGRSALLVK